MNCQRICPFYGRNPEHCDVGFGYISPYHVEVMVRQCTSDYENCGKYKTLIARQQHAQQSDATDQAAADTLAGGLMFPLPLDRETLSAVQHALRTPLTSIRSFTEILLSYPIDDPEAQRRFLEIIKAEAERLAQAVDLIVGQARPAALKKTSARASVRRIETAEAQSA